MKTCQLIVVHGHEKQVSQVFLVPADRVATIGRSSTCDCIILDHLVSGLHCLVHGDGKQFVLRDLLARNGVLIEGHPIDEHILSSGDRFRIGKTILEFQPDPSGEIPDTISLNEQEARSSIVQTGEFPSATKAPVGQKISDRHDLQVAKLGLLHGILTHRQIREALNIQTEMAEVKIRMSLAEIFEEREYLSPDQIQKLLNEQEFRRTRNKDHVFGRVAASYDLVTEEQLEEALKIQEDMYENAGGSSIPRVGEILVTKGYLSVVDSNRIMKGIRDHKEGGLL